MNNLVNATAIGYNAKVDASNKVRVGSTAVTSIGGNVDWTTFSDGRFKQQIKEDISGLQFIKLLRPVSYIVDLPGLDNFYKTGKNNNNDSTTDVQLTEWEEQNIQQAATHRQSGFIAQEVEQAAIKTGFTFSGVDKPANDKALYGLRYAGFVVPLVKAVQEQQSIIEELKKQMYDMKKEIEALKSKN